MEVEVEGPGGPGSGSTAPSLRRSAGGEPDLGPGMVGWDAESVQRQFWLSHMRIGFAVFLVEGLAVAVYLRLTPSGEHRTILWAMTIAWLALGGVNLSCTGRVAGRPWRSTFSVGWTILSVVAVGGVVALDGGLRSPLLYLFFLPISYAAWAFSPLGATLCGASTLGVAAVLVIVDRSTTQTGQALVLFSVLAGTGVLATSAALNRARRESRERMLVEEVEWLAAIDPLTGCVVRRVFHERLEAEVSGCGRHERPLSLVMLDVDRFKQVNDTYGHLVGDQVLSRVGQALRSQTRPGDTVARLGGDEFGMLLPDTDPESAVHVAERVRAALKGHAEIPVTVSAGIGTLNRQAPSGEQLLDDADLALYRSKHDGRDGVSVRTPAASASGLPGRT